MRIGGPQGSPEPNYDFDIVPHLAQFPSHDQALGIPEGVDMLTPVCQGAFAAH